jgi:hypothetical protein
MLDHPGVGAPAELAFQEGVLRIGVLQRHRPEPASILYRLDRRLELIDMDLSNSLRAMHRQLESTGQLDHPLTEAEVAQLRQIEVLKPFRPTAR